MFVGVGLCHSLPKYSMWKESIIPDRRAVIGKAIICSQCSLDYPCPSQADVSDRHSVGKWQCTLAAAGFGLGSSPEMQNKIIRS